MPELPKRLAFIDVETTGGRVVTDRVIEIGILRVENNRLVKTYKSLVDPQCQLPQIIQTMTGISQDMVDTAPSFRQIADDVSEMVADCVMVAHNVRFDYSFIKTEFGRANMVFRPKHFCTVKLARALYPALPHHDLSSIIREFGFACQNRHRAFDDAAVLWDFYQHILNSFPIELVAETVTTIAKKPTTPTHVALESVYELPQTSGVYIFWGEENIPLYVGKSINIKARVLSHFSADYLSQTEMKIAQQTKRIETMPTCGELGALLKESALVKELKPLFNRQLRYCQKLTCLKNEQLAQGYQTVSFETYDTIAAKNLSSIFGIFKSRRQAKQHLISLAEKYQLCQKLLGVEKASGPCFAYRLGKCAGACAGQENPAIYNLRFLTAFIQTRIKPWPYAGPIMLLEHDQTLPKYDAFVVDRWCLIDQFQISEQESDDAVDALAHCLARLRSDKKADDAPYFDSDCYRIITSYVKQPKNARNIYELHPSAVTAALKNRFPFGVAA